MNIIKSWYSVLWVSLVAQTVKNPLEMQETQVQSLEWEDPLEKDMASHSSIPVCRIPWTGEPGGLQSMRVAKSYTQLKQLSTAQGLTLNPPNTSDCYLSQRLFSSLQGFP